MFEVVRSITRGAPVLLDTEQQLEVQRDYLAALRAKAADEGEREKQKAAHKLRMAEHDEAIAALLEAMETGLRELPVECILSIDKEREKYKLERTDTMEVIMGGALGEWALNEAALPSDTKKGEVKQFKPRLVEAEAGGKDEAAPGESGAAIEIDWAALINASKNGGEGDEVRDAAYWEGKVEVAIGGIDFLIAAEKYRAAWPTRAESLTMTAEASGISRELAAWKMGARAAYTEKSVKKNPFQANDKHDGVFFQAWAEGWNVVHTMLLHARTARLNEQAVTAAQGSEEAPEGDEGAGDE